MARVYVSSVINARSDRVWARIRDFNGLPNWHPAIAESRIENGEPADKIGCVRDFRLRNGDRIRERLLGLSDHDMFCTYSILESPMGVDELRRDLAADAGHRRRAHLRRMDRRVRLRAGARGRAGRRTSAPACSRAASTRSSARSEADADAARRQEHHHRRARSTGCGRCCATSTATTAGIRRSRRSAIERGAPSDKVGCVRRFRLQGRRGAARAAAHALRPRTELQLLPARYADPAVQLRRACAADAGDRRRPHLLGLGVALHHARRARRRR